MFDDFLPVNVTSDSNGAFGNPTDGGTLRRIGIEVSPDVSFFGVVGDNRNEEVPM